MGFLVFLRSFRILKELISFEEERKKVYSRMVIRRVSGVGRKRWLVWFRISVLYLVVWRVWVSVGGFRIF